MLAAGHRGDCLDSSLGSAVVVLLGAPFGLHRAGVLSRQTAYMPAVRLTSAGQADVIDDRDRDHRSAAFFGDTRVRPRRDRGPARLGGGGGTGEVWILSRPPTVLPGRRRLDPPGASAASGLSRPPASTQLTVLPSGTRNPCAEEVRPSQAPPDRSIPVGDIGTTQMRYLRHRRRQVTCSRPQSYVIIWTVSSP